MKSKFFLTIFTAGVIFLLASFPAFASLYTYSFDNITNTIPANVAIGQAQLSVDVTDVTDEGVNPGQVLFTFWNKGQDFCSIVEVYFADGTLLEIAALIDCGPKVDFQEEANPPNLSGWNNADPPFVPTTAFFSTQADNPAPKKGVNPGEWLGIKFDLQVGLTFDDVLTELKNGDLRIGLHVTAFDLGESESFINNPISTSIPIPATVWMFGAGLAGLIGIRRKLVR